MSIIAAIVIGNAASHPAVALLPQAWSARIVQLIEVRQPAVERPNRAAVMTNQCSALTPAKAAETRKILKAYFDAKENKLGSVASTPAGDWSPQIRADNIVKLLERQRDVEAQTKRIIALNRETLAQAQASVAESRKALKAYHEAMAAREAAERRKGKDD